MIKSEKIGNIIKVSFLIQELDADSSEALRIKLDEFERCENKKIVIDFTGIKFVSSLFLGIIITALKNLRLIGGDIKLCSMRENIKKVFEITRLDKAFDIYNNTDEAMKSFNHFNP